MFRSHTGSCQFWSVLTLMFVRHSLDSLLFYTDSESDPRPHIFHFRSRFHAAIPRHIWEMLFKSSFSQRCILDHWQNNALFLGTVVSDAHVKTGISNLDENIVRMIHLALLSHPAFHSASFISSKCHRLGCKLDKSTEQYPLAELFPVPSRA